MIVQHPVDRDQRLHGPSLPSATDANKVHSHEALLQCSLWHPSRPTPGVLNSRERLRAAIIGGRTARGVVGTPTPGNGGQGRAHAQERLMSSCLLHLR